MDEQRTLERIKENIVKIGLFILFGVLFFVIGRCFKGTDIETIVQTDTIVETDTVVDIDTVIYWRTEFEDKYIYDTIVRNDTVYIKDEPQLYKDSTDRYQIEINAVKLYDYNLTVFDRDSMFYTKEIVIQEKKEKKWKLEFCWSAGFGVHYGLINKNFDVGPYVGFGVKF